MATKAKHATFKNLLVDKEFHSLITPLSSDEREQLEKNIVERKMIRDPLVVWGESMTLLDGHNRYEIAKQHGIGFRVVVLKLADREAAKQWIIRNQLGRRNLTNFQRVELALLLKSDLATAAQARQITGKSDEQKQHSNGNGRTRDAVAKAANVSHDTVSKVERIKRDGDAAVQQLARTGKVKINQAAKVSKLPKEKQHEIAKSGPKAIKAAAKKVSKKKQSDADETTSEQFDEIGVLVPDQLDGVFADREVFDQTLNELKAVSARVNALHASGFLEQQSLADLRNLRSAVKFARPFAVCPICSGKRCPKESGCHGTGFMTQEQYERVPQDERRRHERDAKQAQKAK